MPIQKVSREEIIEIATKVFHKQGYHKTSMQDIAIACNIQKGSLYHHFKGKEEMMKDVLKHFHEKYQSEAYEYAINNDFPAEEKLNRLIDFSEKTYLGTECGSLMGNIVLETMNVVPGFVDLIKEYFKDWIKMSASVLEHWYSKEGATKIAKESIASIEGAVMMMMIFDDPSFLTRVHERMRRLVSIAMHEQQALKN